MKKKGKTYQEVGVLHQLEEKKTQETATSSKIVTFEEQLVGSANFKGIVHESVLGGKVL